MNTHLFRTALAALLLATTAATAQAQTRSAAFVEASIGTNENGNNPMVGVTGGYLWALNNQLSVGGMIGVQELLPPSRGPWLPIGVRGKYRFSGTERGSFFVMADAGWAFDTYEDGSSLLHFRPAVGYDFGKFYLGAGYSLYSATNGDGTMHHFDLRLGWTFGGKTKAEATAARQKKYGQRNRQSTTAGTKNRQGKSLTGSYFEPRLYPKVEVGGMFGLTGGSFTDYNNLGSGMMARVVGMYDFNEHIAAGLGTGLETLGYKPDSESFELGTVHIPVYVRGQVTLGDTESSLRPYVACDLGYRFPLAKEEPGKGTAKGIMLEPQVGLTHGQWSVGLGYALTHFNFPTETMYSIEDCTTEGTAITLRLGYSF